MTHRSALAVAIPILAATLVLGLSGCSGFNNSRGLGDSPVGARIETPALIIEAPDQMMNVAPLCLGRTLIVRHTRESPPVVVDEAWLCTDEGRAWTSENAEAMNGFTIDQVLGAAPVPK